MYGSVAAKKLFKTKRILRICLEKSSTGSGDYSLSPEYPKIQSLSKKAVERRETRALHDKYRALNTVEEKLFALNLPRYYGWKSLILREGEYPYDFLPFVQHVTRTRLLNSQKNTFHNAQLVNCDECQEIVDRIAPQIQEAIVFEIKGRRRRHQIDGSEKKLSNGELNNLVACSVVEQINNIIMSNLSSTYPHLLQTIVDYKPRTEAFWAVGGFDPTEDVYKEREKKEELSEEEKKERVRHWIQYLGRPFLQLRNTLPINVLNTESLQEDNAVTPGAYDSDAQSELPVRNHDPVASYGLEFERRHGTNIPGFWPGDVHEYSLLSFHGRGHLLDRPPHFGGEEAESTICAQSILASYSWLHSLASYQGFSTFDDVTYPMVTQSVVTDGQRYSFFLYQLNTTDMTTTVEDNGQSVNPRVNLCLALPTTPLFTSIEGTQIIGWNDDVLSTLVSLYLNIPQERVGVNMKPYLKSDEMYLRDVEDEKRRTWLHNQFRHMYSNRPRHRLPYEVYDWERIYKIEFETRPFEARMRPFELGADPMEDRKYYEHMPPYIPRKDRPRRKHWTGWRAKFAKTFYPNV